MGSKWDLIVAGAGPAGSALAAKVAVTGARVLLLAKGVLTAQKVLRHFQSYPSEYAQEALDSWVSRIPGYP